MSFWSSIKVSTSGLSAQRLRLDLISNNIANVQTTKTADGEAYQRQDAVFTTQGTVQGLPQSISTRLASIGSTNQTEGGVQATIYTDTSEGSKVYEPTNANADADGYVTYSNVDLVVEMTNMLSATRTYEANLKVVDASEQMALKALDIGA